MIGLAEGIAGIDYAMTVVAVTAVQVRVMPMGSINLLMKNMASGLRGIIRSLVMRTLKLPKPTPQLL